MRFNPPIVGSSELARSLRELVHTLADTEVTVLITGESGVGKEVLARNLHRFSPRAGKSLVSVNCAALAPGTLESELFGHDRGAFTGAIRAHPGLFEQAHGGTLFLDEIGEIPPFIQAKLLRVLQEGEVRRLGEACQRRVDVRLVSATNADLAGLVHAGGFRKDLFYRINVVEARIPPLRHRCDDVFDLIEHFYRSRGFESPSIEDGARHLLREYRWPGNVRELFNELERATALHGWSAPLSVGVFSERLVRSATTPTAAASLRSAPLSEAVRHLEEDMLRRALIQANWNKSRTARSLGVSRHGLLKKIRRYGLEREGSEIAAEDGPE